MDSVPRGTSPVPPVPTVARGALAPERLALLERYVASLASDGVVRGLIGPRETPRLWSRHVLNCLAVAPLVPAGSSVCDIGSGAGLPGLVLAIARPDVTVTLVEPLLRRTTYLEEVVTDLGLSSVTVERGRADALHGRVAYDVVTSRAVAGLDRLLDWSMPLVSPTGRLLAMKGSSVWSEIDDAADTLRAWGCALPEVIRVAVGEDPSPLAAPSPSDSPDAVALDAPPEVAGSEVTPTEAAVHGATTVVRVAWQDPAGLSWPPVRSTRGAGSRGRSRSGPANGPRAGRGAGAGRRRHVSGS